MNLYCRVSDKFLSSARVISLCEKKRRCQIFKSFTTHSRAAVVVTVVARGTQQLGDTETCDG